MKFNIGDMVEITDNAPFTWQLNIGCIGVVTGYDDVNGVYLDFNGIDQICSQPHLHLKRIKTKETSMNKQEAKEQVKKLQEELEKLQGIIEAPEGRWRAYNGGQYFYVVSDGSIGCNIESGDNFDKNKYRTANYFQTREQAEKSNLYKILNDPYEYYFSGVSDNWDDVPRDGTAEFYGNCAMWSKADSTWCFSESYNHRWKK